MPHTQFRRFTPKLRKSAISGRKQDSNTAMTTAQYTLTIFYQFSLFYLKGRRLPALIYDKEFNKQE